MVGRALAARAQRNGHRSAGASLQEGSNAVATGTSRMPSPRKDLMDIHEVAGRLRVSVGCVRAWRLRGEGPPAIRVGSALRWDPDEVESWIDSRRESVLEEG